MNHEKLTPLTLAFTRFAADHLGIQKLPKISFKKTQSTSFGGYIPSEDQILVSTKSRHPVDFLRSLAHELVHHAQKEQGRLTDPEKDGETGSDIENEANAKAGELMRHFGRANPELFKSSHITEESINEGLYDQGRHTAVILAGGTGAGKNWVKNRILDGHGLSEIDSDRAYEHLMAKHGLSKLMPPEEQAQRDAIRPQAKTTTSKKEQLAIDNRNGLIINGTGDDPAKIAAIKARLEAQGYKTMMVSVAVSNKTSRARNIQRGKNGGRSVPEEIRQAKWVGSHQSIPKYKEMFGDNFIQVNNDADYGRLHPEAKQRIDREHTEIWKKVHHFTSTPPDNPQTRAWQTREAYKRNIANLRPVRSHTEFGISNPIQTRKLAVAESVNQAFDKFITEKMSNTPSDREWGKTSLVRIYKKATPGQPPETAPIGPTTGEGASTVGGLSGGYSIPLSETQKR